MKHALEQDLINEDLPYDSKSNFLALRTSHTQIYATGNAGQTFTYGDDQD